MNLLYVPRMHRPATINVAYRETEPYVIASVTRPGRPERKHPTTHYGLRHLALLVRNLMGYARADTYVCPFSQGWVALYKGGAK